MKALFTMTLALALVTTGCGPRQVEVTTGPQPAADVSLNFTNNLTQAVNLYVTTGGTDVFLKQVAASSSEVVPVRWASSRPSGVLAIQCVRIMSEPASSPKPSYHNNPTEPKLKLPPGSCDSHFHVFGPKDKFPFATDAASCTS